MSFHQPVCPAAPSLRSVSASPGPRPGTSSSPGPGPGPGAAGIVTGRDGALPPLRFRGWAVVAGSFAVQAISFGAVYSVPAFAAPLQRSFGASDASVSLIYALSAAMAFAVGAVSGPISDRFGTRWPVSLGMAVIALGFLLATRAQSFAEVQLCYGFMVGVGAGLAYVPALAVVQRWFLRWRGLASGIATAGVGFGTMIVPTLSTLLDACGAWQTAFTMIALGVAVAGIAAAQLLARSPERCGLHPDGASQAPLPSPLTPQDGVSTGDAVRGSRFALLLGGCMLLSAPIALPFVDLSTTAQARGLDPANALWLISLVGGGSILGRVALGPLADRLGRSQTLLGCCCGVAVMMALWAGASNVSDFAGFALGFGLFQGGFVALLPSVVADLYGRRCAGGVLGALFTGRALAVLLTPPGVAALSPAMGHAALLWILGGLALLGTGLLALALRSLGAEERRAARLNPPLPLG